MAVAAGLASLVANAEPILITNPSFEGLTGNNATHFDAGGKLRPGHFTTFLNVADANALRLGEPIPGWECLGASGTMAPVTGGDPVAMFPALPNGQNTAYFDDDSYASQVLTAKYQTNTRYILTVEVGSPAGLGLESFPGYSIGLGAGLQSLTTDTSTAPIPEGQFKTVRLAYSVTAGDPVIGQAISIQLFGMGPQTHYDHVRLDAEPLELPVATIAPAVEISWPSKPGESYRIEQATQLSNPDWTPITGKLNGTGARMNLFQPAAEQARYYRVVPVQN